MIISSFEYSTVPVHVFEEDGSGRVHVADVYMPWLTVSFMAWADVVEDLDQFSIIPKFLLIDLHVQGG